MMVFYFYFDSFFLHSIPLSPMCCILFRFGSYFDFILVFFVFFFFSSLAPDSLMDGWLECDLYNTYRSRDPAYLFVYLTGCCLGVVCYLPEVPRLLTKLPGRYLQIQRAR